MSDQHKGIIDGRQTAAFPPGTVVFLVGMRINSFRSIRNWWPVFTAMPRMLRELYQHPDSGFLGARSWTSWRLFMVQQYWTSMDDLMAYARSTDQEHFPAWKAFNTRTRGNTATGIWHEAYVVDPGTSHVVYVNMPDFGIASATSRVAVTPRKDQSTPAQDVAR
ncbi:MAG: DUF4188 domain-containing protein [Thermomicrobiales bacterium]